MAETVAHEVGAPAGSELEADPRPDRGRPRIAYLSWSTGEFDARTERMAATALAHGYDVVVYARLEPGLEPATDTAGYRIVRVAAESGRGIPGGPVVVRLIRRLVGGPRSAAVERPGSWPQPGAPSPPGGRGRLARLVDRVRPLVAFPVRPLAWAAALEAIV